jgi:UDP-glucose:glycoprotein glucosyltransferase
MKENRRIFAAGSHKAGQLASGEGHIQNKDNVENLFYDLPTTSKRRNQYLYPSSELGSLRIHSLPQLLMRANVWNMGYVWPGTYF